MRPGNLKWGIVAIAAVVGLVAAGAAQAQTHMTTETKSFEIISVDGNVLVVRGADGAREITVPADFLFTVDGKKMSVGELKAGMKGAATITTTTTIHPVYVTEVKNGEVVKTVGTSVVVHTKDGYKMFSQGEVDKRGIRIYKDGKPVQLSELRERDQLTAMIVTEGPPHVMTEKQVEATLAAAPAAAPAPAAAAPAPAAAAPAPAPTEVAPAPAANTASESATGSMSSAAPAPTEASPAGTTAPTGGEPAKGGSSWLLWAALILLAVIVLYFIFGRSRT